MTVNVNAGGTLAGNGMIDPPVGNGIMVDAGGTLEPGTPGTAGGTLTITGSLTCFRRRLRNPVIAQRARLRHGGRQSRARRRHRGAGAVRTIGNTLFGVDLLDPDLGRHADGNVQSHRRLSGRDTARVTPTLSFDTHDTYLSYGNSYLDLATPAGANQNQVNVINGIDNAILSGATGCPTVSISFHRPGSTAAYAQCAETKLDGEDATGAITSTFTLMDELLKDLMLKRRWRRQRRQ